MVLYSWILNQRSLKILWTASHHHTVSISTLLLSKNKNTVEVVTTINPCQERKKITYQNKKITEKVQLKVKESDQHQSILISVWLEKIISKLRRLLVQRIKKLPKMNNKEKVPKITILKLTTFLWKIQFNRKKSVLKLITHKKVIWTLHQEKINKPLLKR